MQVLQEQKPVRRGNNREPCFIGLDGISIVMKQVRSRYAQYINKKYKRTGTLGDEFFAQMINDRYGIKVGQMVLGRPRKVQGKNHE